jgi:hypothetical protein
MTITLLKTTKMQLEFEDDYTDDLIEDIDFALKFINKKEGTEQDRANALNWVKRAILEIHLRQRYDEMEYGIPLDKYKSLAPKEEDLKMPELENMAGRQLRKILYELDDDRKMLGRYARDRDFTEDEQKEMDGLNEEAAKVWGEIMRRRGPRPEKTE